MASFKCEKISEPLGLGEGPHWDSEGKVLYFVDMVNKRICKYDPETAKCTYAVIDKEGPASILIPIKGQKNKFLATIKREICVVEWDGESNKPQDIEVITTLDENYGHNMNDGKIDACGRLWSGLIGDTTAGDIFSYNDNVLYSFGRERVPKVHQRKITLSNGMGWSPDNRFMYYIDTHTNCVDVFDFDLEKEEIANRRTVINLKKEGIEGAPDGMTVDTDGNIWVAVYYAQQVIQVDPTTGKVLRSVRIPCPNPASVAFGGQNFDELFVTTSSVMMPDGQLKEFPDSGCTFRISGLGARGLPMHPFPL